MEEKIIIEIKKQQENKPPLQEDTLKDNEQPLQQNESEEQ